MSAAGWDLYSGGAFLLSLVPDVASNDYSFETLADGWALGSPEATKAIFASLAVDGDDERISRYGNRTVPFRVKVRGADLGAVAAGERALRLALNRAPDLELRYTPPDGYGEVCVFDVLLGEMSNQPDDLALVRQQPWAEYAVALTCKPFVRSVDPVTTTLTYGTDAGTSLDDGTSTTPWSSADGSLSAVTVNSETAVKLTPTIADAGRTYTLSRTSLALTAAKPVIGVTVAMTANGTTVNSLAVASVGLRLGSTSLGASVAARPLGSGFTEFFFTHALAGTSQTVEVQASTSTVGALGVFVGGLVAYSSAPDSGLLIADVEGSERAPMTLRLARTASSPLGATFIYSDPTMLEYGWNPGDATTWPNAPAGSYVAAIPIPGSSNHFSTLTLNGQASSTVGGVGSARFYSFQLGTRRDGTLGTITKVWADEVNGVGSAESEPSPIYLFRDAPGETALIYLSSVTGRYLFVDSPTIENGRAIQVWSGDAADASDAVSMVPYAEVPDSLAITPPRFALWVKSSSDITVTAEYYPLSHTFVPRPGLVS